ncbi:MAG: hypothetical protein ACRDN0_20880 [Trebonia sp.]
MHGSPDGPTAWAALLALPVLLTALLAGLAVLAALPPHPPRAAATMADAAKVAIFIFSPISQAAVAGPGIRSSSARPADAATG